jgi:hypothetical protein
MKSKLVWLAIGGMLLAGCGTAATSPTMATAPQNYKVMGGEPAPAPAPVVQPAPVPLPPAPCIDCGSYAPWAAVERDYGFNTGWGVPFGYRDVLYDASPWARGFGIYGVPCEGCGPLVGGPGIGHPGIGAPGIGHPGIGRPGIGHPGVGHGPGHNRPMPGGDGDGDGDTGETTTNY